MNQTNNDQPAGPEHEPQTTNVDASSPGSADAVHHRTTLERIKNLPAPVGVLLVGFGVAGLILPGPMGTPLIIAGGLVLAPRAFGKVEKFFERRFPKFHRAGLDVVERFVDDLDKRYPGVDNGSK